MADGFRPPLPPNPACGSPTHGSPLHGPLPRGSAGRAMAAARRNNPCSAKKVLGRRRQTICHLPSPPRGPSACEWPRRTVARIAKGDAPLRLVEPAALSPGGLPHVGSFVIHLPGAPRPTGITRPLCHERSSARCEAELRGGAFASWSLGTRGGLPVGRTSCPPPVGAPYPPAKCPRAARPQRLGAGPGGPTWPARMP